MKILYSDLKKLVPGLRARPKEISQFLTMAGFMLDGFSKIKYLGRPDTLMSFEVRHNRGDCLSVISLAREVAAKWGLKLRYPTVKKINAEKSNSIRVADGRFVKRVMAYEISGIRNGKSPRWLIDYLALHGINGKNILVDLSNYVMLLTGYPSHLLDREKIQGKLYWDMNVKFSNIKTLDGTSIRLNKDKEIILRDDKGILALAGIVGGKRAELSLKTTSIIAEAAVYDSGVVRQNAAGLKVITEAGTRLSKYLDPNGLPSAMEFLLTLIIRYCGNSRTDIKEFRFYPQKHVAPKIKFNPATVKDYAGIKISPGVSRKILLDLGFQVKKAGKIFLVTPPIGRIDVSIPEDLIEEITRLYGFEKIPVNEIPEQVVTKNITPKVIDLAEKTRDVLSILGLDEILTSPLIRQGGNTASNYRDWQTVSTQNAVNKEFPDLRQGTAWGLLAQLDEYEKKNIAAGNLFEIGKVFGRRKGEYWENEALGILCSDAKVRKTRNIIENLLGFLGIKDVDYQNASKKPSTANPYACWDIFIGEKKVGIIYKLKAEESKKPRRFAELDLSLIAELLGKYRQKPAIELMHKLITLDANVTLPKKESVRAWLKETRRKIGPGRLFNLEITDAFPAKNEVKYTVRATYMKLRDPEAKKLHRAIFNL